MLSMLTLCSGGNFILPLGLVARHPLWQTLQESRNHFPCLRQAWSPYSHQITWQVTFSTLSTWKIKETETGTCVRLDPQTKSMWVSFLRSDSEIPWFLLCTCHLKNVLKVKSKIKKTERSSNLTPAGTFYSKVRFGTDRSCNSLWLLQLLKLRVKCPPSFGKVSCFVSQNWGNPVPAEIHAVVRTSGPVLKMEIFILSPYCQGLAQNLNH